MITFDVATKHSGISLFILQSNRLVVRIATSRFAKFYCNEYSFLIASEMTCIWMFLSVSMNGILLFHCQPMTMKTPYSKKVTGFNHSIKFKEEKKTKKTTKSLLHNNNYEWFFATTRDSTMNKLSHGYGYFCRPCLK